MLSHNPHSSAPILSFFFFLFFWLIFTFSLPFLFLPNRNFPITPSNMRLVDRRGQINNQSTLKKKMKHPAGSCIPKSYILFLFFVLTLALYSSKVGSFHHRIFLPPPFYHSVIFLSGSSSTIYSF